MAERDLDEVMAVESAIYTHPWTRGNFADSLRAGYECRVLRLGPSFSAISCSWSPRPRAICSTFRSPPRISAPGTARLLAQAAELARKLGARSLFLEVRPSNRGAQALYTRFGFRRSRCGAATIPRTPAARTRSCSRCRSREPAHGDPRRDGPRAALALEEKQVAPDGSAQVGRVHVREVRVAQDAHRRYSAWATRTPIGC